MEDAASVTTGEFPVDESAFAVDVAIPSRRFPFQRNEVRNPSFAEALTSKKSDLEFCLIKPTAVLRCVVNREPVPQLSALLDTKAVG